jgi:hypothetical protein
MEFRAVAGTDLEKLTAQAAKGLVSAQRSIGRDVAKVARRAVLADVRANRPAGLRFGKYRLGAKAKVEPAGQTVRVTLTGSPAGFWSMSEYGTVAHEIKPRFAKALNYGDVFYAHVHHKGATGHPFWYGAEPALDDAVTPVIFDAFDEALGAT